MHNMADHATEDIRAVDTHGQAHQDAGSTRAAGTARSASFWLRLVGYRNLWSWMRSHGTTVTVDIEGNGAYGAEHSDR